MKKAAKFTPSADIRSFRAFSLFSEEKAGRARQEIVLVYTSIRLLQI
jgi:hypothetical protein